MDGNILFCSNTLFNEGHIKNPVCNSGYLGILWLLLTEFAVPLCEGVDVLIYPARLLELNLVGVSPPLPGVLGEKVTEGLPRVPGTSAPLGGAEVPFWGGE